MYLHQRGHHPTQTSYSSEAKYSETHHTSYHCSSQTLTTAYVVKMNIRTSSKYPGIQAIVFCEEKIDTASFPAGRSWSDRIKCNIHFPVKAPISNFVFLCLFTSVGLFEDTLLNIIEPLPHQVFVCGRWLIMEGQTIRQHGSTSLLTAWFFRTF